MFYKNILLIQLGLAFVIMLELAPGVFAQEEGTVIPAVGRDEVWRIGFWELVHQTFVNDDSHPFYQMTGTERFRAGSGFFGTTFLDPGSTNLLPNVNYKNEDGHSGQDGLLTNLFSNIPLLGAIPTFSLEYIQPTNYGIGIGLGIAYTNIWLDDTQVRSATMGADPEYDTPILRLASHFYMLAASIHPLGVPKTDDFDIFFGIGLSRVESTLKSGIRVNPTIAEYASTTQTQLNSSSGALYFRRIGIASGGKNFGIMLEFLLLGNEEFIENPFAKSTIIDSAIYDSTYNDRGGALPSKVGMPGGITRFSWTYSF